MVSVGALGWVGVGGTATCVVIRVPSEIDLPIGFPGPLMSVEPFIEMGRTAVTVSGSMTAGVTTARMSGELDTEMYNDSVEKQTVEA